MAASVGRFSVFTSMVSSSPRVTCFSGEKQGLPSRDSPTKIPVFFIHSAAKRQLLPAVSEYCLESVGFRMVTVTVASREIFPAGSAAVKVKESTPTLFFLGV